MKAGKPVAQGDLPVGDPFWRRFGYAIHLGPI